MGTVQQCDKCRKTYRYSSFDIETISISPPKFFVVCKCGNKIIFG